MVERVANFARYMRRIVCDSVGIIHKRNIEVKNERCNILEYY